MTPTWYDILGVTPQATPEQIKAAWRDATDKFEPGTGASQFRMFNDAADVLLNPEKRTAYDAELGLTATPADEPETAVEPDPEPDPEAAPEADAVPGAEPDPLPVTRASRIRAGLTSTLGLGILAVLAVTSLVLAVVLGINLHQSADDAKSSPNAYLPSQNAAASSVAERAAAAVLSYDYRRMETDRAAALPFMTPTYQQAYEKLFDGLIAGTPEAPGGAVKSKAVVTATVLSTGVVDASPTKVRVLVFVNQLPVLDGKAKGVLANRVIATMVLSGGEWLLDGLDPLSAGF